MKARISLRFFTSLSPCLMGQMTIKGYVTDRKGQPVIGANVYLKDACDGASTDVNSYFSFVTDKRGTKEWIWGVGNCWLNVVTNGLRASCYRYLFLLQKAQRG